LWLWHVVVYREARDSAVRSPDLSDAVFEVCEIRF
jgi:hypothetical protein